MDLTNNEIDNINERHTKLRQEHEKLKGEVETQNKYNADNQVRRRGRIQKYSLIKHFRRVLTRL